jgi:hypothetical protein
MRWYGIDADKSPRDMTDAEVIKAFTPRYSARHWAGEVAAARAIRNRKIAEARAEYAEVIEARKRDREITKRRRAMVEASDVRRYPCGCVELTAYGFVNICRECMDSGRHKFGHYDHGRPAGVG